LIETYASIFEVADTIADEVTDVFNLSNPPSHTEALEFIQSLFEMSTRNSAVGKKRPALKA
jgi:hypothetical protein